MSALPSFYRWHACVNERQLDIGKRGHPGEKVKALENKADLLIAYIRQFTDTHLTDRNAIEQIISARWPVQTAEDVHQRRFARTGWPHDSDHLARGNVQIDIAQGGHNRATHDIMLAELLQTNDWRRSWQADRLLVLFHRA